MATLPVAYPGTAGPLTLSNLTVDNLTVTSSTIPTNGIYLPAANTVGIATNGALRVSVSTTAFASVLPIDISAAGAGQIVFPAVQNPSANANTLDDYEEGTWTPELQFGGAAVGMTYVERGAFYTKIGRVVNYQIYLRLSAKGSSTGAATVSLPFATSSTATANASCALRLNNVSFADVPQAYAGANDTKIYLSEITNAGSVTDLDDTNFTDTGNVMINGSFIV